MTNSNLGWGGVAIIALIINVKNLDKCLFSRILVFYFPFVCIPKLDVNKNVSE